MERMEVLPAPEVPIRISFRLSFLSEKGILSLDNLQEVYKNKSIVLIDDSLVRGTTCFKIVKMLYEAGAKEVHVRIACPEIKFPDFYAISFNIGTTLLLFPIILFLIDIPKVVFKVFFSK